MADNSTVVGWTSEPNGRGTFGILRSCVTTLALCVYTAVHINIPRANASKLHKFKIKAAFVVVGMFAPELIVFLAWIQRRRAMRLTMELNEIFENQKAADRTTGERRYPWELRHSFYAVMGGFAIDTGDRSQEEYIPGSPRLSLHPPGVIAAAKMAPGILPDIPIDTINDKSKADSLAKTIALVQGSWLILETIMRWSQGLMVTALELNTFSHAICALMVYYLWWHKPLDVAEPTLITAEPVHLLAALGWVCSKDRRGRAECRDVCWYTEDNQPHDSPCPVDSRELIANRYALPHRAKRCLEATQTNPRMPFCALPGGRAIGVLQRPGAVAVTDPLLHQRWSMAWEFRRQYPAIFSGLASTRPSYDIYLNKSPWRIWEDPVRFRVVGCESWVAPYNNTLSESVGNLLNGIDMTDEEKKKSFFVLCVSALAYGGLHGSAWRDFFPTYAEQLLWRISSIYLAVSGFVLTAVMTAVGAREVFHVGGVWVKVFGYLGGVWGKAFGYLGGVWEKALGYLDDVWEIMADILFKPVLYLSLAEFVLGYLFSRVFLVVEAFISLRALPVSAYSTPSWTQYLVHL